VDVGEGVSTLDYIIQKWNVRVGRQMPVEIPEVGRSDLALLFCELGFKTGAEIGVEKGFYSEELLQANPQAVIYSVDSWKMYEGYRDYVAPKEVDGFYNAAKTRLGKYPNSRIVRATSMEACSSGEIGELDFVYLDSNHEFPYVVEDIVGWSKHVRSGGIVSGHDYFTPRRPHLGHVIYVLNAYTAAYGIRPWFVLGAKDKRTVNRVRDWARSWLWVKE
jgi:hypothetical protein